MSGALRLIFVGEQNALPESLVGVETLHRATTQEELAQGLNNPVDAILIDSVAYEGDVHELLDMLMRSGIDIVTLVAVDATNPEHSARYHNLGVTDLVAAPVDWDFLLARLPYLFRVYGERKTALAQLRGAANTDDLTGLPNRLGLQESTEQAVSDARSRGTRVGLLSVALGGFSRINEAIGAAGGDEFLKRIAKRLRIELRSSDLMMRSSKGHGSVASRVGGDEFSILVPELKDRSNAEPLARRVIELISEPVTLVGHSVSCSASIGISTFPEDANCAETLVTHSVSAMSKARATSPSGFSFYSRDLSTSARRQIEIETELRGAVERGEIELHYQPKLEISTGCLSGMEALIRWKSPILGRVPALELVEAAERTRLIGDIGRWVLWEACARNHDWQRQGARRLAVSINVSASQLGDRHFTHDVLDALAATKLEPECLELEVTENVLIANPEETAAALAELRGHGIQIALDDFGAGYASLAYLTQLPLDVLKLDRRFIVGMTSDSGTASIVSSVISIAHGIGLRVVAEGVDNPTQLEMLEDFGCDEVQGFLVSEPMAHDEFRSLLERDEASPGLWILGEK